MNVTLAASAFATQERRALSLLDPLCGRGTTLNQALSYGFHATGVEIDKKDFEAYALFIQRYVKDKGHDPVALVEPDLRAAWGDPQQRRDVRWQFHVRCGKPV